MREGVLKEMAKLSRSLYEPDLAGLFHPCEIAKTVITNAFKAPAGLEDLVYMIAGEIIKDFPPQKKQAMIEDAISFARLYVYDVFKDYAKEDIA